MTSLPHWLQRKIKGYCYSYKTTFANGLIRQSFTGRFSENPALTIVREKFFQITLFICLIFIGPFLFFQTGTTKAGQRPVNSKISPIAKPAIQKQTLPITKKKGPPPPPPPSVASAQSETDWGRIAQRETFHNRSPRNTILVDKANLKLFVAKRKGDYYLIQKEFPVSVGQFKGNKVEKGDKRTPEGIYKVIEIKFDAELPAKYGPMAFVLSYPNERDRLLGKTGSGIWLHGTGIRVLTPDTKGCVELTDEGVLELSSYISYNTPVFIFPERRPLKNVDGRIPVSVVDGLEMEYVRELPLLEARLKAKE